MKVRGMFYRLIALCVFVGIATFAQNAYARPMVMTTFTILQDITREIGGTFVDVDTLVGANGDAHTYQPSADDAKKLTKADLIIANGLYFEGWMDKLIASTGSEKKLVVASHNVTPRHLEVGDKDHGHDDSHGTIDAHAWQDVRNVQRYARVIADALKKLVPEHAAQIEENVGRYDTKLKALDDTIRTRISAIPRERRKIITSHDAFGYFGKAYGITFLSPVGISTSAEPSASNVALLIRQIKSQNVRLVFIENMTDPRLVAQIAHDTGVKMGGELFTDSLSAPDGHAPSYLAMQTHNLDLMIEAMRE